MNTPGSLFGRLGRGGIILASMAIIWWLITRYGLFVGIVNRRGQILALVILCVGVTIICCLPAIQKYAQELAHRRKARQEGGLPENESRLIQIPPHNVIIQDIRQTLRQQYGRLWGYKIRILLMTGHVSDVEQRSEERR